jgi:hypothetical protein
MLEVSEQEQRYICSEEIGNKLQAVREKIYGGIKWILVGENLHTLLCTCSFRFAHIAQLSSHAGHGPARCTLVQKELSHVNMVR